MLCGMAALHVFLWIGLNANEAAAEARFIRVLDSSVVCPPGRAYGWEMLGIHYKRSGGDERSIEAYRRAIEIVPNPRYRLSIGDLNTRLGRFSEAVQVYEQALTDRPDMANVWTLLGEAYFQVGRSDESLQAFYRGLALDPTYLRGYLSLCMTYNKLGRYREAVVAGRHALALAPDTEAAHYELLRAYLYLGETESARRAYEALVRIAPDRARGVAELFE